MYRPRLTPPADRRRAVILMIVLVLLTLFAIVGLAFVLYADNEADAARITRETQAFVSTVPSEQYDSLMNYAIGQVLFGVGDPTPANPNAIPPYPANPYPDGAFSAARGHDLARDIYGWDLDNAGSNIYPFNGVGHLHSTTGNPWGYDDHALISYVPYLSSVSNLTLADGFARDPERLGMRANLMQLLPPYTGGWNSSYTYPDGNHVYLGAVDSYGNVLARSFYRPYLVPPSPFNTPGPGCTGYYLPLDPKDPNYWSWYTDTNPNNAAETVPAYLKYTCLRPRTSLPGVPPPANAMAVGFPLPGLGGDVKNLRGLPGPNDSIWMDIDYPVKTASNGVKYKPLFAFFIMDMDGKININATGNARALVTGAVPPPYQQPPANNPNGQLTHLSNQGWGPWEINPAQLASNGTQQMQAEWPQLFIGNGVISGRYGSAVINVNNPVPGPVPQNTTPGAANSGRFPHWYAQGDFDGGNELGGYVATQPLNYQLGVNCFPSFPQGYGNGSPTERSNHPLLYDPLWPGPTLYGPQNFNRRFPASNMVSLLNQSVLGTNPLNCDIGKLLPNNMSNPRIPWMITTDSYHINRPAVPPWLWDTTPTTPNWYGYGGTGTAAANQPPTGLPVAFPPLLNRNVNPPPSSDFNPTDWRHAVNLALSKVNLNRFLSPYPHMGSGTSSATFSTGAMLKDPNNPASQLLPYDRFDGWPNSANILAQFQRAQLDRQTLANDIYRRLLLVTGVPAVAVPAAPTAPELASRRWLAQLAANIVDYIDEDEISTPFNFYTTTTDNLAATAPPTNTPGQNGELSPVYWVFGTEMPKVLVNEALAEYQATAQAGNNNVNTQVQVFVELVNRIPVPAAGAVVQPQDGVAVPFYIAAAAGNSGNPYNPYILVVTDNNVNPGGVPGNGPGLATGTQIPTTPPFSFNDLVLGTPNTVRTQTDFSNVNAIQTVGNPDATPVIQQFPASPQIGGQPYPNVGNTQYFLVGPQKRDSQKSIEVQAAGTPGVVPANPPGTAMLVSANMQYPATYNGTTLQLNGTDGTNGINVLLRRLVNPHLPFDANPNDQAYNPYMTVDYMGGGYSKKGAGAPSAGGITPQVIGTSYNSAQKDQPYAGYPDPTVVLPSQSPPIGKNAQQLTTFGQDNAIQTGQANYNWLMHLDRQLTSPLDLLHVSGCQPWELTRRFVSQSPGGGGIAPYNHQVNWFDETNRLYRLFAVVTTKDRTTGVSAFGRVPGMININTMWDPEVFLALCDPQISNTFNQKQIYDPTNPNAGIFAAMLRLRSPGYNNPYTPGQGGMITGNDRPFLSMGVGNQPNTDPQAFYDGGGPKPGTTGIEDTFLRSLNGTGAIGPRLFDNPSATLQVPPNPQQTELMRKIYGHITTRSNVFAVWCTVGYFQVIDDTVRPVKLGAELGAATNTNIRQRFFTIVDRSRLVIAPQVTTTAPAPFVTGTIQSVPGAPAYTPNVVNQLTAVQLNNPLNNPPVPIPWSIQPGSVIVIDNGTPFEETVVVQSPPAGAPPLPAGNGGPWIWGSFQKLHGPGATITIPGNPGPQPRFNVNDPSYGGIVAAYGILE